MQRGAVSGGARTGRLLVALVAVVAILVVGTAVGSAGSTPAPSAASAARVWTAPLFSLGLSMVPARVEPYRPGDKVWLRSPPPAEVGVLGSGCQRVPASGYIGQYVYAQTTAQYSNYWSWSASSASQPFHWYVFTSGGVLKADGGSSGGGGSVTVPANIHYWKVQNLGSTPQAWNVCWSG